MSTVMVIVNEDGEVEGVFRDVETATKWAGEIHAQDVGWDIDEWLVEVPMTEPESKIEEVKFWWCTAYVKNGKMTNTYLLAQSRSAHACSIDAAYIRSKLSAGLKISTLTNTMNCDYEVRVTGAYSEELALCAMRFKLKDMDVRL